MSYLILKNEWQAIISKILESLSQIKMISKVADDFLSGGSCHFLTSLLWTYNNISKDITASSCHDFEKVASDATRAQTFPQYRFYFLSSLPFDTIFYYIFFCHLSLFRRRRSSSIRIRVFWPSTLFFFSKRWRIYLFHVSPLPSRVTIFYHKKLSRD